MTAIMSFFFMMAKINILSTVIGVSCYWKPMLGIVGHISLCLLRDKSIMKPMLEMLNDGRIKKLPPTAMKNGQSRIIH